MACARQPAIPIVHMPGSTKTENNREYRAIRHSATYTYSTALCRHAKNSTDTPEFNGTNPDYPSALTAQPVIVDHF